MKDLYIEQKKDSFGVECLLESGIVELKGTSYPENALEFFNPIFNWVEAYIRDIGKEISLNFRVEYLNSSSLKCIMELLDEIEEYYMNNGEVKIIWFYKAKDRNMKEIAEELLEDLELPYELIAE